MAVRRLSLRLPACPSLDGTASLDLGSAEYCNSLCTFSAELICMAMNMGALLPSSLLEGLALCCSKSDCHVVPRSQRFDEQGHLRHAEVVR